MKHTEKDVTHEFLGEFRAGRSCYGMETDLKTAKYLSDLGKGRWVDLLLDRSLVYFASGLSFKPGGNAKLIHSAFNWMIDSKAEEKAAQKTALERLGDLVAKQGLHEEEASMLLKAVVEKHMDPEIVISEQFVNDTRKILLERYADAEHFDGVAHPGCIDASERARLVMSALVAQNLFCDDDAHSLSYNGPPAYHITGFRMTVGGGKKLAEEILAEMRVDLKNQVDTFADGIYSLPAWDLLHARRDVAGLLERVPQKKE